MPVFSCHTLEIVGIEALLRCQNLAQEGINPELFIAVANKTNLIKNIDFWIIENSFADLAQFKRSKVSKVSFASVYRVLSFLMNHL